MSIEFNWFIFQIIYQTDQPKYEPLKVHTKAEFNNCPDERLTTVPRFFIAEPCLTMVGDGVTVVSDHDALSAPDHGTLPTGASNDGFHLNALKSGYPEYF